MARIRSIHPGQWTDAEFLQNSPLARLLALALRNEADDQGVFEWKPAELKLRCLPSDDVDINALLTELVNTRQVMQYVAGGKRFGLIRNFTVYQRPKTPTRLYPMPQNGEEFPFPADFPKIPEICPRRMKDEGEGGREVNPPSPDGDAPPFEPDDAIEAIEAFNALAIELNLPKAQLINSKRRRMVRLRLRDAGGLEGWAAALAKVRASPFCQGGNDRGWRIDLDSLCQPKTFTNLMEGRYDDRRGQGPHDIDARRSEQGDAFRRLAETG